MRPDPSIVLPAFLRTPQPRAAEVLSALEGRRLLEHPFYRRWEAGELSRRELAEYAGQYRHFERELPAVLRRVAEAMPPGRPRELVERNLRDELAVPAPHADLFEDFASSVGAPSWSAPGPATVRLVSLYRDRSTSSPVAALAVIGAYEQQAADVARTKAMGLRRHYGVGERGTRFWDVHARLEESHADWTLRALGHQGEPRHEGEPCQGWNDGGARDAAGLGTVYCPAKESADAWWEFLDEREAAA